MPLKVEEAAPKPAYPPADGKSPDTLDLTAPTLETLEGAAPEYSDLLSSKEIAEIKAEALKQFTAERKKIARAKMIQAEIQALRAKHGPDPLGGCLDDMVTFVLDLPDTGGGPNPAGEGLIINQEIRHNGSSITVPRHVANSIMETMWRGAVAQHNLDGKTRAEFYRRQRPVVVTRSGAEHSDETVRVS